jgi:tRNA pseudouridine32 synthase/23S rRNA pseudouridine746 synthase
MTSEEIVARILHRDALILVIDKPAGLPVHPGPKGGETLTDHLEALRFGLPRRPQVAHRLDWAVVEGGPADEAGEIGLPLAPRSPDRGWWMRVDPAGQPALTRYRVLGRGDGVCALELRPVTGRTHQLRVHCQAMGFPIVGDPIYGSAPRFTGPGLHLHARGLTLPYHPKKPPVAVTAPLPAHMRERIAACGVAGA